MIPELATSTTASTQMDPTAGLILAIVIILFVGFIFLLIMFATIFWIWMIVDCAKRKFKEDNEKVIWILLMVFLGVIASIIYYFVIKREADKRKRVR